MGVFPTELRRAKVAVPEFTEADDIRNRLQAVNLSVSDIKMVIITHLHWDHTGGLRFFDHCPILIQNEEHRFAYNPDSFFSPQYMRNHLDFPLSYKMIEGDRMVMPGVSVIKTPGHTPGHQSVLTRLNSGGYYIFSGDAVILEENLTRKIPSSNNWNNQQSLDSLYRLEHLAQLIEAEIMPSHDMSKWQSLRKSPDSYT